MADLICRDCGSALPPRVPGVPGRNRLYCDGCRRGRVAAYNRAYARSHPHPIAAKPADRSCPQCGIEFEVAPNRAKAVYCGRKCLLRARYERMKADGRQAEHYRREREKFQRQPDVGSCLDCGGETSRSPGSPGRVPQRCPDCTVALRDAGLRALHERRMKDGRQAATNAKRRKHDPRPCVDCGKTLRVGMRCRACSHALHRTLNGVPDWQRERRRAVFERDHWVCQLCGDPVERYSTFPYPWSPSIDHIVPLRDCLERFGPDYVDNADNWQTAHWRCNASKGARAAVLTV